MVAEKLKHVFDQFFKVDIQVWKNFEKLGVIKELPKETVIKKANTTERYFNFVINGSGGILIWKKSNFICIDIAYENDFLNDYMSFTMQKATPIEVRLFEDSSILQIPYENFQKTFAVGNFGEKITRLAAEISFIDKQNQQIDLLTKTAKQRYLEILKYKKGIERIPLKYLASYLGITPQSLSRIRSGKMKEL